MRREDIFKGTLRVDSISPSNVTEILLWYDSKYWSLEIAM